jgi:hypothetical protein
MFRKNDTDAPTLYFQRVLHSAAAETYEKLGQHLLANALQITPVQTGLITSAQPRLKTLGDRIFFSTG